MKEAGMKRLHAMGVQPYDIPEKTKLQTTEKSVVTRSWGQVRKDEQSSKTILCDAVMNT